VGDCFSQYALVCIAPLFQDRIRHVDYNTSSPARSYLRPERVQGLGQDGPLVRMRHLRANHTSVKKHKPALFAKREEMNHQTPDHTITASSLPSPVGDAS